MQPEIEPGDGDRQKKTKYAIGERCGSGWQIQTREISVDRLASAVVSLRRFPDREQRQIADLIISPKGEYIKKYFMFRNPNRPIDRRISSESAMN
jgi:hypothetical protein